MTIHEGSTVRTKHGVGTVTDVEKSRWMTEYKVKGAGNSFSGWFTTSEVMEMDPMNLFEPPPANPADHSSYPYDEYLEDLDFSDPDTSTQQPGGEAPHGTVAFSNGSPVPGNGYDIPEDWGSASYPDDDYFEDEDFGLDLSLGDPTVHLPQTNKVPASRRTSAQEDWFQDEDGNQNIDLVDKGYGIVYGPDWTDTGWEWNAVSYDADEQSKTGTGNSLEDCQRQVEEYINGGQMTLGAYEPDTNSYEADIYCPDCDAALDYDELIDDSNGDLVCPVCGFVIDYQNTPTASFKAASKVAKWADVRAKAKRLINEGRVHVESKTKEAIHARVEGDTGTYETSVNRIGGAGLGIAQVSGWSCTCLWAKHAFDRVTYVGRLCSHGLSVYYEMQKRTSANEDKGITGPELDSDESHDDDDQLATASLRVIQEVHALNQEYSAPEWSGVRMTSAERQAAGITPAVALGDTLSAFHAEAGWVMGGTEETDIDVEPDDDDAEMAKAARMFLAGKHYTMSEQQDLIDEGEDVTARNLHKLEVSGTHYSPVDDDNWMGL